MCESLESDPQNERDEIEQIRERIEWRYAAEFDPVDPVDSAVTDVSTLLAAYDVMKQQRDDAVAAHELMAKQFRIMQAEKEHGWREAEESETEVRELTGALNAEIVVSNRLRAEMAALEREAAQNETEQVLADPETLNAIMEARAEGS